MKKQSYTLDEMVVSYKRGSTEYFFQIYTICNKKCSSYLLRKGCNKEDTEDILQDYFSKDFHTSLNRFNPGRSSFSGYVNNIVLLRYITHIKKLKNRRELFLVDEEYNNKIELSYIQNQSYLNYSEIEKNLKILIYSIPNINHRKTIILKYFLPVNLSTKDMVYFLDCPSERTLGSWIYRGIQNIKVKAKLLNLIPNLFDMDDILDYTKNGIVTFIKPGLEILSPFENKSLEMLFSHKTITEIAHFFNMTEKETYHLLKTSLNKMLDILIHEDEILVK